MHRFHGLLPIALFLTSSAHALTIVYTNDVMGELEPCGCRHNPTGGLARKAELLRRLNDSSLVQVDSGNLLFETDEVPPTLAAQAEIQASYQLRAHEVLGHDLVTPGTKDFGLGAPAFRRVTQGSKIRFISVNLYESGKNQRYLEPSVVLERKAPAGKSVRIGFIGVSQPTPTWQRHGLEARAPLPLLQEEIKRLRPQVDRLYLLSQLGQAADEELAEQLTGLDGIFGGRTQSLLQTPVKIGKTRIFQASFRNQYIGTYNPETHEHKLTALDVGYEPQDKNHPIVKLVAEMKSKIAEVNRKDTARLSRAEAKPNSTHYQTFVRCAECHVTQFDFWRKTPHARAFHTLYQAKQHENKDCLRCHTVGLGEKTGWSNVTRLGELVAEAGSSAPAPWAAVEMKAFLDQMHEAKTSDSPVRLRRDSSEAPLAQSIASVHKAWTPVQCENCHNPGGDHPFGSTAYPKAVADSQCLKCHTQERAPQWYGQDGKLDPVRLMASRKKVACPSTPQSP